MKIKFITKMISAMCAAVMATSCVAIPVGAAKKATVKVIIDNYNYISNINENDNNNNDEISQRLRDFLNQNKLLIEYNDNSIRSYYKDTVQKYKKSCSVFQGYIKEYKKDGKNYLGKLSSLKNHLGYYKNSHQKMNDFLRKQKILLEDQIRVMTELQTRSNVDQNFLQPINESINQYANSLNEITDINNQTKKSINTFEKFLNKMEQPQSI